MLQTYNEQNDHIKVFIGDRLFNRHEAKISVFDSSVQGGDAVWEGLRLYPQGILQLQAHLLRLRQSAHALSFEGIPDENFIRTAIRQTLDANNMTDDTHIRLTLTRGEKITSGMDPRLNRKGSCLIVLAEHKKLVYNPDTAITVISSSQRRNRPDYLDSKIHHNNLLNNIIAKIQANVAGVDAAVMLDTYGFVAELNDANLFLIKNNTLFTPFATACLPGISRKMIMDVAVKNGTSVSEANLSLVDFYNADFVFATGTMSELTPVKEIDGREIGNEFGSRLFSHLYDSYRLAIPSFCEMP